MKSMDSYQLEKKRKLFESLDPQILYSEDPKLKWKYITEENNATEDNMRCDICLDGRSTDDDEIFICDLCNSATH